MPELTHKHLLKYMELRKQKLIGPLWLDGRFAHLGLDEMGIVKEIISDSDLADLIDVLSGSRKPPKSVYENRRITQLCERYKPL